jgi:asparagine synthase (glutamine-hydrolysing)
MARRHVTVALSGDGGDEMLSGYPRYESSPRIWRALGRIPRPARTAGARLIRSVSPRRWRDVLGALQPMLPPSMSGPRRGDRVHTLAHLLAAASPQHAYARTVAPGINPSTVLRGATESPSHILGVASGLPNGSPAELYQYIDSLSYLPDDILVKVDRACMGVSLETRVPFLDHRVVEFCWRLPQRAKRDGGQGKLIARQLLSRFVPSSLFERPKMGFDIPLASWLRGPLREWGASLLTPTRVAQEGFLGPDVVERLWTEHQQGTDRDSELWPILMFQAWLNA